MFAELIESVRVAVDEANWRGQLKKGGGQYSTRGRSKHRGFVKRTTSSKMRTLTKAGEREALVTRETPNIPKRATSSAD